MSRPTFVSIDVNAFIHNLHQVRRYASSQKIMAIVKANAYGHGIANLISGLNTADALGVSCLEEAIILRQHHATVPIVLLEGFFSEDELTTISELEFQVVIHTEKQLRTLETINENKLFVWLKIDTGMHRLGFLPDEIKNVYQRLMNLKNVIKPFGLMTHFADADLITRDTTLKQLQSFHRLTQSLSGIKCLANSAAILGFPQTHADWVRPGIMLYGISPFIEKTGLDFNLQPVMTFCSQLIAIHEYQRGDKIGYGGIYTCPETMRVGVVAAGYGDGYPRHAKNNTPVLVNGHQVPLIGRVSMDMLTVDLRSQPSAKIGDSVVLWGKGLPVEVIATSADTIAYELLCGINNRVHVKTVMDNRLS